MFTKPHRTFQRVGRNERAAARYRVAAFLASVEPASSCSLCNALFVLKNIFVVTVIHTHRMGYLNSAIFVTFTKILEMAYQVAKSTDPVTGRWNIVWNCFTAFWVTSSNSPFSLFFGMAGK